MRSLQDAMCFAYCALRAAVGFGHAAHSVCSPPHRTRACAGSAPKAGRNRVNPTSAGEGLGVGVHQRITARPPPRRSAAKLAQAAQACLRAPTLPTRGRVTTERVARAAAARPGYLPKTLTAPSTAVRRKSSVSACWFLAATILEAGATAGTKSRRCQWPSVGRRGSVLGSGSG